MEAPSKSLVGEASLPRLPDWSPCLGFKSTPPESLLSDLSLGIEYCVIGYVISVPSGHQAPR